MASCASCRRPSLLRFQTLEISSSRWQIAVRVPGRRRQLQVECANFVQKLAIGAAATAAIGATVITVRQQLQKRRQEQEGSLPPQRQQRRRNEGSKHGGGPAGGSSWLPELPRPGDINLGWALQDRDKQLARQVSEIDQRRQRESLKELEQWDERWSLRTKSLAELRLLAAQHRIPGRSRMRKLELVAALEAALGLVPAAAEEAAQAGVQLAAARRSQRPGKP